MECIISIIVPIYNVEDYIDECLKSILNQTYSNYEVIVIDDGCTDRSIEKINKYNDKRIKIISQTNRGLSAARNTGLRNSIGNYVVFLDSDDYWADKNYLKNLIDLFNKYNCDVVVGKSIRIYDNKNVYNHCKFIDYFNKSYMSIKEFLSVVINYNWIPVWLYCFKIDILRENKIYFKEGFLHEDEDFTLRALISCEKIAIYNSYFYGYRQRQGSITKTRSEKNISDIIKINIELQNFFNNITDKKLKRIIKERAVRQILKNIYYYDYKNINKEVKKFVLINSNTIFSKFRATLLNINRNIYFKYEVIRTKLKIPSKFEEI